MFVVRFGINGENTDYYFNNIRKARLFERKILLIVYDDIEKNDAKTYHDLYFFIKDIKNTLKSFDYNCDNDELKKWILQHENNEYYFDIESYVEEIQTSD